MIDLYYWTTPNGHKITIFLEETSLTYNIKPINLTKGEQFTPDYLTISPNNKIPAIIDNNPLDGKEPITIFESGAILLYLSQKTNQFYDRNIRIQAEINEWLFWQVGGLGPMSGQNAHFLHFAKEKIPYAIERYQTETTRLYNVLERQLANKEYIAGEYSIADIATYPWIVPYQSQQKNLDYFPNIKRWFLSIAARPAVKRAYAKAEEINPTKKS
jgi:GST-like protein